MNTIQKAMAEQRKKRAFEHKVDKWLCIGAAIILVISVPILIYQNVFQK